MLFSPDFCAKKVMIIILIIIIITSNNQSFSLLSVDRSSVNQDVDCGPIKGIARHLTAKAFITLDPKKLLSFIFIIT